MSRLDRARSAAVACPGRSFLVVEHSSDWSAPDTDARPLLTGVGLEGCVRDGRARHGCERTLWSLALFRRSSYVLGRRRTARCVTEHPCSSIGPSPGVDRMIAWSSWRSNR